MGKLYILGGRERRLLLKERRPHWSWYEAALILEVDTESGAVRTCVQYKTPLEARAGVKASVNFHSSTLVGDTLYTCTTTEVLIFKLPEFKQIGYISLPCFNDVHHVVPTPDGNLLVVSTGLDLIVKVSRDGQVLAEWSAVAEDTWTRFSRGIDYRKVESTKPHKAHPNFVFELDGELWVTRFNQRDAVALNGSRKRIEISVEKPHDGVVCGDRLYFTVVDGKIVIVNRHSLTVEQMIDLQEIGREDQRVLPAWCRGLLLIDERKIWVGFTRIRETQFHENIRWIKTTMHHGALEKPTHIALYDIVEKRRLKQVELEPHGMNTVFSILPATIEL
jgi:hypothetical protein